MMDNRQEKIISILGYIIDRHFNGELRIDQNNFMEYCDKVFGKKYITLEEDYKLNIPELVLRTGVR